MKNYEKFKNAHYKSSSYRYQAFGYCNNRNDALQELNKHEKANNYMPNVDKVNNDKLGIILKRFADRGNRYFSLKYNNKYYIIKLSYLSE